MNIDTIAGEGAMAKGEIKQSVGQITKDPILQGDGLADELFGSARKALGLLRDMIRNRPLTTALIGGLLGMALVARSRGR